MPLMGGRDLAKRLLGMRKEMKVLYMSGYTDDSGRHFPPFEPAGSRQLRAGDCHERDSDADLRCQFYRD